MDGGAGRQALTIWRAPRPRTVRHEFASALHLAKTAWRRGCRGLACMIVTRWDTGFQAGDVRTARAKHLGMGPANGRLIIGRSAGGGTTTGAPVIGTLSRLGDAMVRRSATTEPFRGGADSKAVSQKFGNSIDRSAFLLKTHSPVDLEQARVRGRRKGNS